MAFQVEQSHGVTVLRSTLLSACGVRHAFSTRFGGVSTLSHTAELNVAFGRGDTREIVLENTALFLSAAEIDPASVVSMPQVHGTNVLVIRAEDVETLRGAGVYHPAPCNLDAYVTDAHGIAPMVKIADCAPVLLCDPDAAVIAAVHSGWRGSAAGISVRAIEKMERLGAVRARIRAAVGPCIHTCCYEVGRDLYDAVIEQRGQAFTDRFITPHTRFDGKYSADIPGMIKYDLLAAGMDKTHIDIAGDCTCCMPERYHSHRATGGLRGTMGAVIAL